MKQPVYRSLAESFRLDIYLPECGLIAPPAAAYDADRQLSAVMESGRPPQAVFMRVDERLIVQDAAGEAVGSLDECMRLIKGKAVPILWFEREATGSALAEFARENCLGDVTLCVPYEKRALLCGIRRQLPLSRGMLDLRGCGTPEFTELVGECQSNEATMLLLNGRMERSLVRSLQKRFIQVWAAEEGNLAEGVSAGVCGILTRDVGKLYDFMKPFSENTTFRPTPLYAHKAYHVTGEYPENSIRACAAAGRLGYDAAEIDVQLTRDDVMVVHHDRHTRKLFDEDHLVFETDWEVLKEIRRKAFPEDGLDRMDDLMMKMAEYPETPVLIEIKTPPDTFGVEEMVRQMKEMLARKDVQQACTCIMGVMPPYLSFVHEQIPYMPTAHCTCVKGEEATDCIDENNLRIYKFAMETRSANAGFNPYHPMIGKTFTKLAHVRGITVFPWTWAFEPWEECREAITASFLQGHDGLTSDWVGKFYDVPVEVRGIAPEVWPAGEVLSVKAEQLERDGLCKEADKDRIEIVPLDSGIRLIGGGEMIADAGTKRIAVGVWTELEDGKRICVLGRVCEICFQ